MNFLEYLTSLPMEGDVFLLVRQKPILDADGNLQYHADGAVKATYPAYLTTERIDPEWVMYGNTGSFMPDRFIKGRPAARKAFIEYVLVMMLDDIGTKSKTPPLAPTWKMETSPGNFQWGYAFSDQPHKSKFAAAILAIAAAGYTDPGAINPVRNFRLPGSKNLKPGNDGFAARLVEFNPENEYSLGEICEALGVTPGEPINDGAAPITIEDTGSDDVLAWLSEHGKLISPANHDGWFGVVCPNSGEHSDGNPEGRYLPASRAYCCWHSHCVDWDSKRFLDWVEASGGPARESGVRDDLLATAMSMALSKIAPTPAFPDVAAQVVNAAQMRELSRLKRSEWFERFAYVAADDTYLDIQTGSIYSRRAFNALYRSIDCRSIHGGRRIEASVSFDEERDARGAMLLEGLTYAPGDPQFVETNGQKWGNWWRNTRPEIHAGAPSPDPWLRHCERVIPIKAEREHVYDVMAFKVQNPRVKINHAILLGGIPGCGKDLLFQPFLWAIGGSEQKNVTLWQNDKLTTSWGYQFECEVLLINELRETDAATRRALENRLKPIIAAPPLTITIERKHAAPYDIPNRLLVLATTNYKIPIFLDSDDRRWFCLWSPAPKMLDSEWSTLLAWYMNGGCASVASWLAHRDVSKFLPGAAPPITEFKAAMVEDGLSPAESFVLDHIRERRGDFALGIVGAPLHAICDRLTDLNRSQRIPLAALLHALQEADWIDLGRVTSGEYKAPRRLFCAPELRGTPKSELRRRYESSKEKNGNVFPLQTAARQ